MSNRTSGRITHDSKVNSPTRSSDSAGKMEDDKGAIMGVLTAVQKRHRELMAEEGAGTTRHGTTRGSPVTARWGHYASSPYRARTRLIRLFVSLLNV